MWGRRSRLWGLMIFGFAILTVQGSRVKDECKKRMRQTIQQRCGDSRSKRDLDVLDPIYDYSSVLEERHPRKRHIMSIRKNIISSRVPMYDTPYPPVPSYTRHRSAPIVPPSNLDDYQTSGKFESLPQESGNDADELDDEDIADLFNEFYDRIPRSPSQSKEELMQEILLSIYKCCKNEETCLTKKEYSIPCAPP